MKHSKGGRRAVLGEDFEFTTPHLFRQKKKIDLAYKLFITALILTPILLILDWTGTIDKWLGV